jgi:hypothetical protein
VFILILGQGSSSRIKDDFVCRSYFDSVEWEEREDAGDDHEEVDTLGTSQGSSSHTETIWHHEK